MHKRTGFYPASANDYLEPLQLLKEWVDHLIFCDLNVVPYSKSTINELRKKLQLMVSLRPALFWAMR
jgi:hypothetical protein